MTRIQEEFLHRKVCQILEWPEESGFAIPGSVQEITRLSAML